MTNRQRIEFLLQYDADFRFERAVMGDDWMATDTTGLFARVQACVRRSLLERGMLADMDIAKQVPFP